MLHALSASQHSQVEYVACQMQFGADELSCGQSHLPGGDDAIEQCIYGGDGTQLQLEAERQTNTIKPRFVPTIVYNGIFDQRLQDRSQYDFKGVVCELLQNAPESCSAWWLIKDIFSNKNFNFIQIWNFYFF